MKITQTTYHCEKCNKKLSGHGNSLNIVTELSDSSYWSRLHVQIIHRHGVNNDAIEEQAELCPGCAVRLLKDAVKRIIHGERASAGTESSIQKGWDGQ